MKRAIVVAAAAAALAACATGAPRHEGPTLELSLQAVHPEAPSIEEALFVYNLKNPSREAHEYWLPYEWDGLVYDWFKTSLDGKELPSALAYDDYSFPLKTVLEPGMSVSMVFGLSTIVAPPKDARGTYEVRLAEGVYSLRAPVLASGPPASLRVTGGGQPKLLPPGVDPSDAGQLRRALRGGGLSPAQASALLLAALRRLDSAAFWDLAASCPETYAVVAALEAKKGLPPKALSHFLASRDLSVRRAALRAAGRAGPSPELTAIVEAHLRGLKDEPSLEYGRKALENLR